MIRFENWNCILRQRQYANGRIALELIDADVPYRNESVAVCTVNLPNVRMAADEVAIKDYSENEGMLNVLIAHGIVSTPLRYVQSGFVEIPICKLLWDGQE